MLQLKRESMIDLPIRRSPVFINPFACNTAMRAEHPVPVGERSSLPGSIATVFLLTLAPFTSLIGSVNWQKDICAQSGLDGWSKPSCSLAAADIFNSELGQIVGFIGLDFETKHARID